MDELSACRHLLVLPRVRIQNANAVSGPMTHGFPAMTAFLGLMWALERKTQSAGLDLLFNKVAVVVHRHEEQITHDGFVHAFRLTRNPLDKDGSTAAIVEEGRIHLEVTLIFAVDSRTLDQETDTSADMIARVYEIFCQMRVAGGSVIPGDAPWRQKPYVVRLPNESAPEERQSVFDKFKMRLLPGFLLVDRTDLIEQRHARLREHDDQATRLDAWLSLSRINWHYSEEKDSWQHDRQGWVVPIPVGYGALTDLLTPGSVANSRDPSVPFCFVESLYSIGEWVSPHRLHAIEQMLWYADSRPEQGLYRCRNDYRVTETYDFD